MAPVSGIYRITHAGEHREPHEALIIRGEELPHCRTCMGAVSYEVVQPTSHITHEWDFAGPGSLIVKTRFAKVVELRAWRRCEVELPVLIHPPRGRGRALAGQMNDVGEGGINVTVDGEPPSADVVRVQILLPHNSALMLKARLRHVRGSRCGFEFLRPGVQQRQILRDSFGL
jgi:hypothetical protein